MHDLSLFDLTLAALLYKTDSSYAREKKNNKKERQRKKEWNGIK